MVFGHSGHMQMSATAFILFFYSEITEVSTVLVFLPLKGWDVQILRKSFKIIVSPRCFMLFSIICYTVLRTGSHFISLGLQRVIWIGEE